MYVFNQPGASADDLSLVHGVSFGRSSLSNEFCFFVFSLERPSQSDNLSAWLSRTPAPFSSNLARKKRRLEGNGETVETRAEEMKTAKFLMLQDFPIILKDFN
jgi:hypothetical protein